MANLFIDKRASNSAVDEWGHEGNDTILGSRFGDKLKGAQGNDTIHGNAGNDQIMDMTWVGTAPDIEQELFTLDVTDDNDRRRIADFIAENYEIRSRDVGGVLFHGGGQLLRTLYVGLGEGEARSQQPVPLALVPGQCALPLLDADDRIEEIGRGR